MADYNNTGFLDFVQVLNTLGLICSNKYKEKLRLLYILHTPPLLTNAEIDFMRKPQEKKSKDEAEEAIEAEDFFDEDPSESIEALPLPLDQTLDINDYDIANNAICTLTSDIMTTNNDKRSTNMGNSLTRRSSTSCTPLQSSIFYVDLFDENNKSNTLQKHGRVESTDTISDISDLGAVKLPVTPSHVNVETISNFSDISDLVSMNPTTERGFISNATNCTNEKKSNDSLRTQDDSNSRQHQTSSKCNAETGIELNPNANGLANLRGVIDHDNYGNTTTKKQIPNLKKCNFQILWKTLTEILGEQDSDMIHSCK